MMPNRLKPITSIAKELPLKFPFVAAKGLDAFARADSQPQE
jgi:hypothetical protein